jgi:O-antigen ligase
LVILSDNEPEEAFRAVFVRCAYVLIPLSVITLRWFPDIGRAYNRHTGAMEAIGLTFQKNTLGALVLITGLITVWDIIHRLRMQSWRKQKLDILCRCSVLVLGAYLLNISDSMTATLSLVLGALIIAGYGLPAVRRNAPKLMVYGSVTILALFSVDRVFGISEWFVGSLGRDMTFTGRTVVWQVLLDLNTNPIIGTGFRDFWSNMPLVSKLPEYIAGGRSAHNGYLEVYLDGGLLGVGLLTMLLLSLARRIHREMGSGEEYAFVRLGVLVVALTYNFSESNFARITPVWFLFLLGALNYKHDVPQQVPVYRSIRTRNIDQPEASKIATVGAFEAN